MKIIDVFEHDGKKAIYLDCASVVLPGVFSKLIYNKRAYKILKHDISCSIAGQKSIVVLIDTDDVFEIGREVAFE